MLFILLFQYLLILKELNVSFDFLAKQYYRKKVRYCHKAVEKIGYVPYDCCLNHCAHESGNNENCKIYAYPLLCEKVNETASAVYPPPVTVVIAKMNVAMLRNAPAKSPRPF